MQVLCDFCEQPLPIDGNDVRLHRTKVWDTRLIFPHLCERCGRKLDVVLSEYSGGMSHKRKLIERMQKLNEERKEKLGTKG